MTSNAHVDSIKKYLSAEREAKREELGLWKGTFDMPWDWRKNVKK